MRHAIIMGIWLALTAAGAWAAAEQDLAARWDFDEGKGEILHDTSGNGNDGEIHGASWVKCGRGYALRFDGTKDYVNCGKGPALDIRGPITLEAWVYPGVARKRDAGIVGKQFSSFLLADDHGNCYWYLGEGANHCVASLPRAAWSHLAATFDGRNLRLFLNGRLVNSRASKFENIPVGGHFFIGCVVGDPAAADPAYSQTSYFNGILDDVRVYRRALSEDVVAAHYRAVGGRTEVPIAEFAALDTGRKDQVGAFGLRVADAGAIQIDCGPESYVVESSFSYPGERIGHNRLSRKPASDDAAWKPAVKATESGTAEVQARGRHYALTRRISARDGRIEVADTLINLTDAPVAILVEHAITAREVFCAPVVCAIPENPTMLLPLGASRLGVVIEDTLGRLQVEGMAFSNQAAFGAKHFALDAKKSYTFRWALYPLDRQADYFAFVNRIREDWKTNFTLEGPCEFLDARDEPVNDPEKLRAYLGRKNLRVVSMGPWLDYWTGQHVTRPEAKTLLEQGKEVFRKVAPEVKVVGQIETDWVAIHPEQVPGFDRLPFHQGGATGQATLSPEQARIIEDAKLPWADSLKRSPQGALKLELFTSRDKPGTAIYVYPRIGNYQQRFLMEEVKFLIDDCGLDGFYIDEFSQARCYSYERWDGHTVDIDPETGSIERKYTDCGLVFGEGGRELADYALSQGKIVVANWPSAQAETQPLPIMRFMELPLSGFHPENLKDGEKPPLLTGLCRGHLASPICFGVSSSGGARGFYKGIITLLRNGILYYYADSPLPESGEGAGEYGPINHMFPITPVRLFEGGVEGKERTITCVSGTYAWKGAKAPTVLLFDAVGRLKEHSIKAQKTDSGWSVAIRLMDWQEIAVMEQ
ncbi:MAG: LamG domain-containing protein [Pirellulales bacterium]|nr:LamG domain-containing protein [Pirellulales bacterium]